VGLTGGIGSGKSTVARLLAEAGAAVVDTDDLAREVTRRGTPTHRAVAERFGPGVVSPGGDLDRQALAELAFADAGALAELTALVHPAVAERLDAWLAALPAATRVAVVCVPLLVEAGWARRFDVVVVVDCPEAVAEHRLVEGRGMTPAEVRARMAAQATREERRAAADHVLDNRGPLADLRPQVAALWLTLAGEDGVPTSRPGGSGGG